MKKFFYFLAAASMVAVACAKEETVKENVVQGKASGNVTLTASMPEFTNADTKAAVSDAGVFSWTAGDIIDVVYEKSGSADKTYQFECTNASTGEFTNVDAIDDGYTLKTDGSIAFYPHEYNGTPSSQTFDSPALAAKGFQMHATYSAGNLAFVHDNAMMKVTVTNVPYFAGQLVIGSAKVDLTYAADQASATYYVPVVAAASAKLSIAVKDGTGVSANDIIAKSSKNAVAIVSANLYELPDLGINRYIAFENSDNATHRLGIQGRTLSEGWNGDWTSQALTSNGSTKYYMLSGTYASAEALQIQLRQNDGADEYAKSEAEFVVNDRNFKFDVSENSLKTDYRIYFEGTPGDYNHAFAYYRNAYTSSSAVTFYIINEVTSVLSSVNHVMTFSETDGITVESDYTIDGYGHKFSESSGSSFVLKGLSGGTTKMLLNNGAWGDNNQTSDSAVLDFKTGNNFAITTGNLYIYSNGTNKPGLSFVATGWNATENPIWGAWPGSSFTVGSYLTVLSSQYGQTIWTSFTKAGGADPTSEETYEVYRDYIKTF